MPTVRRFDRCRIEMYFGDHPPPHFHVVAKSGAVLVRIDTLTVIAGSVDSRDVREALEWAAGNRSVLMSLWQQYSKR